ncbi:hypothetical protein AMELA_G00050270 [Ameiurus melas]|uniref:Uncharacterized protein n=1 Tax=Ameiurus melas TaxID=219545 RepID=A0A7J6B8A1_AMEME|nr:hypothetical protein AMELA_G00050270 [Ameiurus melas]
MGLRLTFKRATQDAECDAVEELVQWMPCRGGATALLVTRELTCTSSCFSCISKALCHCVVAQEGSAVDRFQYRFWTC